MDLKFKYSCSDCVKKDLFCTKGQGPDKIVHFEIIEE